jgi:hypothetical protein
VLKKRLAYLKRHNAVRLNRDRPLLALLKAAICPQTRLPNAGNNVRKKPNRAPESHLARLQLPCTTSRPPCHLCAQPEFRRQHNHHKISPPLLSPA